MFGTAGDTHSTLHPIKQPKYILKKSSLRAWHPAARW